jgi:hypothetical protein
LGLIVVLYPAVLAKQTASKVPKSAPKTTRRAVKVARTIKKSFKPVASQAKKTMKRGKTKARIEANKVHRKLTKAAYLKLV